MKNNEAKSALDGVPIAIKDNLFIKGVGTTAASAMLDGFVAPVDSTTVARLKAAGALIIGSANMDEFGMGSYGLFGKNGTVVRNPRNTDHVAGGSSAGSSAMVASY